jgi:3'-phosphoadenosine 5'-phosphosulfate (PAPS) 3'-phosphatase
MEVKDIIAKGRPSASVAHLPEFRYIWGVHDGYEYALEEFENNRLKACESQTEAEAERELNFAIKFFEEHHRQPTFSDAIEVTRKQMIDKACKWLEQNVDKYLYNTGGYEEYIPKCGDKLFYDFKKAMEE